jgi:hypothetical protein
MSGSITKETGPDACLGILFLAYFSRLGDDELAVGIVLHEHLWDLYHQIGASGLPHGVVELLAVDEAVPVSDSPDPFEGADAGEGDQLVVLEDLPGLLSARVAGHVSG